MLLQKVNKGFVFSVEVSGILIKEIVKNSIHTNSNIIITKLNCKTHLFH